MDSRAPSPVIPSASGSGAPPGAATDSEPFSRALLSAMLALNDGDFSVRLPRDLTGVNGKIADAFNDIARVSERRARETARVSHARRQGRQAQAAHVRRRRDAAAGPTRSPRSTR